MGMRFVGRWLGLFTIAWFTAGAVASCGGGNDNSTFVPPNGDASLEGGGPEDSSMGGREGGMFGGGDTGADGNGGGVCKTCKDLGYTCGMNGDGCGHVLDCGSCTYPEYCGGGGFSKCGGNLGVSPDGGMICTPTTCAALGYTCGMAGDGCGKTLDCGTCTSPEYCGGGGFSKCGGNNGMNPDGGIICMKTTCAALNFDCGMAGDGCGGVLNCGTCTNPQYCGGAGPNHCGGNNGQGSDGGLTCMPTQSCASLGYTCGYADDGCGNLLNCGGSTCPYPQFCGGGGANKCGGNTGLGMDGGIVCTPYSNPCATANANCGVAPDGCGNVVACGTCTNPQYCGGGGPNKCGGNNGKGTDGGITCTPTQTCASLGYTCGYGDDGCGNLLNCGGTTCPSGQFCGGGGPNKCGTGTGGGAGCDAGTTTLSGYVFDPGNHLPVYNALVYVPVGAVQTPQTGVVPAQCGCTAQPAYASAFTDISGKFTLSNPPSGAAVTVVVQLGKWQRVFSKSITACTTNNLGGGTAGSAANLTLPSTHTQGNIPLFAIDTGNVDTMECVLLKMGIAQSEFVDPAIVAGKPTAVQRIHMYQGTNVAGGAIIDGNTPGEATLTETSSVMDSYDVILFPCQGGRGDYSSGAGWPNTYTNMANYSAAGGRFFTTHFHYDMLQPNPAFTGTANWSLDNGSWGNLNTDGTWTANINQGFARGVTLSQWLNQAIVYGGTYGQIPVGVVRNDYASVNAPSLNWLTAAGGGGGPTAGVHEHYTFDTPFNQSPTCGRVVYSDFHVESSAGAQGSTFPGECAGGGLTAQEKLLEFMLFDLTSCVTPPTCQPLTCADFPATTCGVQGDGCGGQTAYCNPCPNGQTCGGGGVANQCGAPDAGCVPKTCANFTQCGVQGDGCGGQTPFCNPCPNGQVCGGGGPGVCGAPDAGCVKMTCSNYPGLCGQQSDGCGGLTPDCTCPSGQSCLAGTCGVPDAGGCTPETCSNYPPGTCGQQSDGCGGLTQFCNPCVAPATCGGGGTPNMCGFIDAGICKPLTCGQEGLMCGPSGDGCGGLLDCGPCASGQMCIAGICKGVQ